MTVPEQRHFVRPSFAASVVNRCYGWLASRGFGPSYSYLLEVKGRKTGKVRSTPVNILRHNGKIFLVGTRGHTEWSRNAQAAGGIALKRGRVRMKFRLCVVPEHEKPELLSAYLARFAWMASRFFPLCPGAPSSEFVRIAGRYPVFELVREP